jgi:poly(3-hydroxybutyrate) depolymerase
MSRTAVLAGLLAGALLGALLVATPAPASTTTPPAGSGVAAVIHLALADTYRLHVPPGTTGPVPLVVSLPASGWPADQWETTAGFDPVANRGGFAVATVQPPPDGRWNGGMCCVVPGHEAEHGDDTPYVLAVVADVATRVQVDPDRVYVAGGSGGAMKAWQLACDHPEVFAAAGVVSGVLAAPRCGSPVAVLQLHGTLDGAVPFYGGPGFESSLGRPPFPSAFRARLRCPRGSILPQPVLYPGWPHRWMPPGTPDQHGDTRGAAERLWAWFAPLTRESA